MAAPLALLLFVLFPRIQGPLWGMPGDAQAGRSGLSNRMAPGAISRLALSDDIAFRVRFIDPPPPMPQRYWRGPVLGQLRRPHLERICNHCCTSISRPCCAARTARRCAIR